MKDLSHIKMLVLDVDGTLTDGGVYILEDGKEAKKFNSKDGLGIRRLQKSGVEVALLSGSICKPILEKRSEMLYIERWFGGRKKKIETVRKWCKEIGIELNEVAYIGDDVNDLEVIRRVGFSACPSDAVNTIRETVDEVLDLKGGDGCVREFIDRHYPTIFD